MSVQSIGKRRKCWGRLPKPDARADLYWGVKQPELRGLTDGQLTALMIATPEFAEVIKPELDAVDERNRNGYGNKNGRPSRWAALQLESILLYRRVAGLETIKRACERLHFDQEARQLLELGKTLPSRATITRYIRQHFDEDKRAALYRELDRALRQRVVQLPGFDQEARKLGMDGSQHGTRYTPPIPKVEKKNKPTGKFVNENILRGESGAITAPTAGYVGGNHPKSGKGWQLLGLFTEHGTLVAWDISPVNENEKKAAHRVLANYEAEVLPHRGTETLSVCTADGAFHSAALRQQLQELRIVPNIHKASHKIDFKQPDEQTANAAERNKTWLPFRHPHKPHYENWQGNGHAELLCSCDAGITKRVFEISKTGTLSIATKGHCPTCGDVTITAGQWRRADSSKYWTRCHRGNQPDPSLGNSLTFNDPLSREYGQDRYGFGESVHASIERRFGLLKDKSWMRDITEVETEFAIAASAISVLLLERDTRRQASSPTPITSGSASPKEKAASLPLAA
jgi:hypothetical protein